MPPRAVVLVEGHSDRLALLTLAGRRGRSLADEGIEVVAMGGITNTRSFASHYGPSGLGVPLAGLYDAPAEAKLRHGLTAAGLEAAGLEAAPGPEGLAGLGFFGCAVDLEDELIRALGVEAVEAVIDAAGEARSLRLLAGMPAQRDRSREAVLRRFLGSRSGRKARYAALLVEALPPGRVPDPLADVLAHVGTPPPGPRTTAPRRDRGSPDRGTAPGRDAPGPRPPGQRPPRVRPARAWPPCRR